MTPCAPTQSASSAAGSRCSVPRIAHVRTSVRSVHSARFTAPGSSPSTRAHSVSSAEDCTWACSPQMRETTACQSSAAARARARPWRATRQASTASQLSSSGTPRNLTHRDGGAGRRANAASSRRRSRQSRILPDMTSDSDQLCVDSIRALAMDAIQKANSGHPGLPMAMAPAAFVLYRRIMRHDPADPQWPDRDRFLLSAGPRLDAALRHPAPHRLRPPDGRDQALPPVGLADARATPSATASTSRPASRSRPARSAQASPTASAWRSPRSSCASTTARRSRTTTSTRSSPTATSWRASPPRPRRSPASSASAGSSTSTTTTTSRSTARRR